MNNLIFSVIMVIVQLLVAFGVFAVIFYIVGFFVKWIKGTSSFKSSRFFNLNEYLPEEEVYSLKQLFYLVMILVIVMNILYLIFQWQDDSFSLLILDIIVSLYITFHIDGSSFKDKLLLLFLVPASSIAYLLFSNLWLVFFDIFHIIAYLYFIKFYYHKFNEFTQTNSLGITIMFLFLLTFVSFLITIVVEGVSPVDSITMVSNAITSNGYTVLGESFWGKINSVILVWSGYMLSGIGTATLASAIVIGHINEKFDDLENKVKKNRKN